MIRIQYISFNSLFIEAVLLGLSPLSLTFNSNGRSQEKKGADCIGSQWQQKLGGNGIRLAIGFDVNFIVNNYESREHYGSISTPTVSPFVELTELYSQMQHLS